MTGTVQSILNWSRVFIPDKKERLENLNNEEIGRTQIATTSRETFYLKHAATGTVTLYIEPYEFSSTASLSAVTVVDTDRVFMYNATLQRCIIPKKADVSIRPAQFKPVLAMYKYTRKMPYAYSDDELLEFLPVSISYLNNTYGLSYVYTGTMSNIAVTISTDNDKELVSKALAIITRNNFVSEQMRKGFGVQFKGPLAAIDSKAQMKEYNAQTKALEKSIFDKIYEDKLSAINAGGAIIDVYDESEVSD